MALTYLMDDIIPNRDFEFLKILVILVILSILIKATTSYLITWILSVRAQLMISELRSEVQRKVLSLPLDFFNNTKSGDLVSRIMTDVDGVKNLIGTGLVQLIGGVITAILSLVLLLEIDVIMTLFTIFPMIIFGIIAQKAFEIIRPIFRTQREINADVTGRLTETLSGIHVIKGFNAESQEHIVFQGGVHRIFKNERKSLTTSAFINSTSILLLGIITTGVMSIGAYKIILEELTVGEFLSFMFLLGLMIEPIIQLGNFGSRLSEAMAGLDRTEELMNLTSENEECLRTKMLNDIEGDIKFEKVSFSYEKDNIVLHDISFEVPSGSVVALVGSSGSGKSTIAALAAGFLTPKFGKVLVDGNDLSEINLNSFRQHLGVVLQDNFLFDGTIRENIIFSNPKASNIELEYAVRTANVDEFAYSFKDGLETIIGERGIKLSGGQRQRIEIARAILANPRILILDEATSNLDTVSEELIQESLAKLTKGRTTIVIAHRLNTIRKADQILVIENGRIIETGTHKELMEQEGRYHRLYKNQARI